MKQAKRNRIFILSVFLLLFYGCSKEKVTEDTLVKVYVETVIVNEMYGLKANSIKIHKKMVFDKYRVTEKMFEEEMNKYSLDKETWDRFFKKANDYLNDLKKSNTIK